MERIELVRALPPTAAAVRSEDNDGLGILVVRFAPFDVWYEIDSFWEGNFMERIKRGAFKKTIKERREQIRVLYDHGHDPSIGRKPLGSVLELFEDNDSPVGVVDLFDTGYNRDLLPGLKAGVYGSSFRFVVMKQDVNEHPKASEYNPKALPERTITEVQLIEFGPTPFGANPAATSGVRSATDDFYEHWRVRNPDYYSAMLSRAQALRIGPGAGVATPVDARAADQPTEPESMCQTTTQEDRGAWERRAEVLRRLEEQYRLFWRESV